MALSTGRSARQPSAAATAAAATCRRRGATSTRCCWCAPCSSRCSASSRSTAPPSTGSTTTRAARPTTVPVQADAVRGARLRGHGRGGQHRLPQVPRLGGAHLRRHGAAAGAGGVAPRLQRQRRPVVVRVRRVPAPAVGDLQGGADHVARRAAGGLEGRDRPASARHRPGRGRAPDGADHVAARPRHRAGVHRHHARPCCASAGSGAATWPSWRWWRSSAWSASSSRTRWPSTRRTGSPTFVDPSNDTRRRLQPQPEPDGHRQRAASRGNGLFQGPQTRLGYVPEQQTDFIFTALGEQFGLVGRLAAPGPVLDRGLADLANGPAGPRPRSARCCASGSWPCWCSRSSRAWA